MKKKIFIPMIFASSLLLSSCATIMGEDTQLIPISSTPSDASIIITDETGSEVFHGKTPTTVTLQKSDGSYFGGKSFNVKISKKGYKEQIIPVKSSPNGWFIGGNFILGGLIGWLIVDPMSGAMYTLSPEKISANMGDKVASNNHNQDGSISIVLLQDVPALMKKEMKRIN